MRSLGLDAAAAEAVAALGAEGIPAILLKGPVVATRLYDHRHERPYNDVDVLVDPSTFSRAVRVVRRLGYTDLLSGAAEWEYADHATTFGREGRLPAYLDLHRTLPWSGVEPWVIWEVLASRSGVLSVGGQQCRIPDDPSLALILAGHAIQHEFAPRTRADLMRACERFNTEVWHEASRLAVVLGAAAVLSTALSELRGAPAELPGELTPAARVQLTRPSVVHGLEAVANADSLASAVRVAFRKLLPSAAYMRFWVSWETESNARPVPLGGHGRTGLLFAYLTRIVRRGGRIRDALRRWRTVRAAT
jgi:hypothetical protein